MSTIVFGDFRAKALRHFKNSTEENNTYNFLIEDNAEITWFKNELDTQLPQLSLSSANILIMLGFTDCVHSCVWSSFNINSVAEEYVKVINEAIEQYNSLNFYFCSVNPINADYPFAGHPEGVISKDTMQEKIKTFNGVLKQKCSAIYIDSFKYLIESEFETRDGTRFTTSTSRELQTFIDGHLGVQGAVSSIGYEARDTESKAPVYPKNFETAVDESYLYWMSDSWTHPDGVTKGLNSCLVMQKSFTLPNCVGYAWGRFYELSGDRPKLSCANAEDWFGYSDGYARGKKPQAGAVICWAKGATGTDADGAGHVAIVEKVNPDGTILTSESGYREDSSGNKAVYDQARDFWVTSRIFDESTGNWRLCESGKAVSSWIDNYKFQGFIYNPAFEAGGTLDLVDKSKVISNDSYLSKKEMEINAQYIWSYLGSKGWTLNAVCGLLGNMEKESTINPGLGEGLGSGYGLVQWTPGSILTNWLAEKGLPDDIDGQLERIIWEKDNNKQYYKNNYKYTFKQFAESVDDPYTLACAFAFDYERSGVTLWGFHTNNHGSYCGNAAFSIACRACYAAKYGEAAAAQQAEVNRQALRDARGGAARDWYKFLAPYSTITGTTSFFEEKFIVDNFKVLDITDTSVKTSFITSKCEEYSLSLINMSDESKKNLKDKLESSAEKVQVVKKQFNNLKPNTQYKIKLDAKSSIGGETISKELTFITSQSCPDQVGSIKLTPKLTNGYKDLEGTFTLSISKPQKLGYWSKNGNGYELTLLINGRKRAAVELFDANNKSISDLDLKKFFNYKKYGLTDSIQIGVRTWTLDSENNKVYNFNGVKTTAPIFLLNNTILPFINK